MARVKAEAAKARLSFAKREMKIKLEKAHLEASNLLNLDKETAAATAEAEALEIAADVNGERHSCNLPHRVAPLDPLWHTRKYVAQQVKEHEAMQSAPEVYSLSTHEANQVYATASNSTPAPHKLKTSMQSVHPYADANQIINPCPQTPNRSTAQQSRPTSYAPHTSGI